MTRYHKRQKLCKGKALRFLRIFDKPQKFTYVHVSRLTVVSREAKEEVPCDGLSTNAREYIYKNKPC